MLLTFARQSTASDAWSGERLLNLRYEPFPDGGMGQARLVFDPGLTALATLAAGQPVRAVYAQGGAVYAACGGGLWRYDGAATRLGDVVDDQDTTISGDGVSVAVAAGGVYHVWDGSALSVVSPGVLTDAGSVAGMDGYTLIFSRLGDKWTISGIRDAKTVDPLDVASAEGAPDAIVRGHVDHGELWIFGTRSTEIWSNTGNPDFPFQRQAGGRLDRGCAFAGSVSSDDNSVFWIGDDRVVYRAAGFTPTRVSTKWVEDILQGLDGTADVRAWHYTEGGGKFYALRVPGRPALVFNIATGLWHERGTGVEGGAWLARCGCRCSVNGAVLGGEDGRLFSLGGLTDGGATIVREAVSLPVVVPQMDRFTVSSLRLQFETGLTDIGRDAQVMLQMTEDGRTWRAEKWRSLGRAGEYDRRTVWRALGQFRRAQARIRITDPIGGALYGVAVETA